MHLFGMNMKVFTCSFCFFFCVDKSKQYHYSYTIKQVNLVYDLSQSSDRKEDNINACPITASKRPRHRNQGLNTYILSH